MSPVSVVGVPVQDLIRELQRDRRVDEVEVEFRSVWVWNRAKVGEGIESGSSGVLRVKPSIAEHGTLRGIPAASTLELAELVLDGDVVTRAELREAQPYGLVRLVASALGISS